MQDKHIVITVRCNDAGEWHHHGHTASDLDLPAGEHAGPGGPVGFEIGVHQAGTVSRGNRRRDYADFAADHITVCRPHGYLLAGAQFRQPGLRYFPAPFDPALPHQTQHLGAGLGYLAQGNRAGGYDAGIRRGDMGELQPYGRAFEIGTGRVKHCLGRQLLAVQAVQVGLGNEVFRHQGFAPSEGRLSVNQFRLALFDHGLFGSQIRLQQRVRQAYQFLAFADLVTDVNVYIGNLIAANLRRHHYLLPCVDGAVDRDRLRQHRRLHPGDGYRQGGLPFGFLFTAAGRHGGVIIGSEERKM